MTPTSAVNPSTCQRGWNLHEQTKETNIQGVVPTTSGLLHYLTEHTEHLCGVAAVYEHMLCMALVGVPCCRPFSAAAAAAAGAAELLGRRGGIPCSCKSTYCLCYLPYCSSSAAGLAIHSYLLNSRPALCLHFCCRCFCYCGSSSAAKSCSC